MIKQETFESYKKIKWVSPSSFKSKKIETPAHYKYYLENPEPETEAKLLGSAFHCLILEKEKFPRRYAVLDIDKFPKDSNRTKDGFPNLSDPKNKKVKNDFEKVNKGKKIIKFQNAIDLVKMNQSLTEIEDLYYLLDFKNGFVETSIYLFAEFDIKGNFIEFKNISFQQYELLPANKKEYLLPVKTRVDYWNKIKTYGCDLKCSLDISRRKIPYIIEEYGYHIQAAFILDMISCQFNKLYDTFFFILVQDQVPYFSDIGICTERMIINGREDYIKKLQWIYEGIRSNYYPGYEIFSDYISRDEDGNIIKNRHIRELDLSNSYYYNKLNQ